MEKTINTEITTGELFEYLPCVINRDNCLYFPVIIKTTTGTIIEYKNNNNEYLCNTRRKGKTLRSALIKTLNLLIDLDIIKKDITLDNDEKLVDIQYVRNK